MNLLLTFPLNGLNNYMKILAWFSTLFSVIGVFMVANMLMFIGYISLIIGTVGWFIIGAKNKDYVFCIMQGIFLTANFMGLYNAF